MKQIFNALADYVSYWVQLQSLKMRCRVWVRLTYVYLSMHFAWQVVLDWFAKLLNLPPVFLATQPDGSKGRGGGVIQGTASEACLVAMLAARCRKMQSRPSEDLLKLVAYSSDQAHSCVKKACMIAGIQHCRCLVATSEAFRVN